MDVCVGDIIIVVDNVLVVLEVDFVDVLMMKVGEEVLFVFVCDGFV